ncbi:MAG: peptidoglycan DD-metalloendopeptidase family protein [Clostridia bacterium]|nr:peptidoglycan DD-metalloendopeptidase family protein [Clostridia bacterium]
MKSNNLKKIAYAIIITIIICTTSLTSFAESTKQLENQKTDLQDKIDETSSEMAGIHSKMTNALNEVNKLNGQIADCEIKISEYELQIENLTASITEKEKNIEEQQAKYEAQQLQLQKRLVAVYMSGNTTYLDVLLSSSSLTDFISKYYFLEKLAEADATLITEIQNLKTQIESEKASLEKSKNEVIASKSNIESQKKSIEVLLRDKQKLVTSLSAEEKALQVQLDEFEQDKKEIQQEIARIAAENARKAQQAAAEAAKKNNSSSSNTSASSNPSSSVANKGSTNNTPSAPSSSGFICPIAGRSKNDITTGFYGYKNHHGVDFARNSKGVVSGLPVLAAKSGTVAISKALKRANGTYKSYGEYILINHGDGTMSLYAHMQAGSRKVQAGAWVNQGQQIGNVGSTGNSTGPHLHFEIRSSSGGYLNPSNYLP